MSEETVVKADIGKQPIKWSVPAVLLIGAGILLLVTNILDIHLLDFVWPAFIIGPGLLMLWPAHRATASRPSTLGFMAIPGAMTVVFGGMLFLMNIVNHYESMAYAWTLILAGGAGGYLYWKRFDDLGDGHEKAHKFVRVMVISFMALATFFEIFVFQSLGGWWPLFLIGLGIYLLVKQKRSASDE